MNGTIKRFLWVSAYAMAMAFLEAVVVVYIRGSGEIVFHVGEKGKDLIASPLPEIC
jgi:hypothetical protein